MASDNHVSIKRIVCALWSCDNLLVPELPSLTEGDKEGKCLIALERVTRPISDRSSRKHRLMANKSVN